MSDLAIRAEGLSKRYRLGAKQSGRNFREALTETITAPFRSRGSGSSESEFWALEDVSFEVKRGEVVGIIGRNGAGKSTLLKILSRITEPTDGRAEVYGRVGSLLEIGTGFHPELTGRENVYLNGAILGMKRREIDRQFDEIVDFAEVEKFIDTPVKHYSSGMYVRLAFAVAAHLEPEILIVDEVLAVGDAAFQRKCLGKMAAVGKQGRTILFVSHNLTAIRSLCPTTALLEGGHLVCFDETESVVTQYVAGEQSGTPQLAWHNPEDAPGNDKVRLKSACLALPEGAVQADIETPIDVEFEVWNLQQQAVLNFSLVLYSSDDTCVFNTVSTPQSFSKGLIKGACRIPAKLLNDISYRLRILVVQEGQVLFDDPKILYLQVAEGKRDGPWHGKWVGVVRPALEWRLEHIA